MKCWKLCRVCLRLLKSSCLRWWFLKCHSVNVRYRSLLTEVRLQTILIRHSCNDTPEVCIFMRHQFIVKLSHATTSCKSTWDTVPYFGINGLSMILSLWSPLHPISKLLAIQEHTQNLEEQLWMGGRREVSIISHRPMTRNDLKQKRSCFRGSVPTFLQLVVARSGAPWVIHLCIQEIWLRENLPYERPYVHLPLMLADVQCQIY